MEIGNKIKKLRMNKGITQETLANHLGVSYQAVSRWENGMTMPDISLLPEISVYFGITIDELFEVSEDKRIKRIETMLEEKDSLTEREFKETEDFLLERIRENRKGAKGYELLAATYNIYGWQFLRQAEEYAKLAMENGSNEKGTHNIILDANRGPNTDWNFYNHHDAIDYYKKLLQEKPMDRRICLYALDYLIVDGRVQEAYEVLEMLRGIDPEAYIVKEYQGKILLAEHKIGQAMEVWQQMIAEHPKEWIVYACIADHYADMCEYDKAIWHYKKAYELQPKPRYLDSMEAVAHISEIRGEKEAAIEAYSEILHLLETEWNMTFGCEVDKYKARIDELILGK